VGRNFVGPAVTANGGRRPTGPTISPGMDLRIADYAADIRACRDITPVLRYIARDLIQEELAALSGADPSTSRPAA
jgi:hypothetical protein